MLSKDVGAFLKATDSLGLIKSNEKSEHNIDYISRTTLEKLKLAFQKSKDIGKIDNGSMKSTKSFKKRLIKARTNGLRDDCLTSQLMEKQLTPFKSTYENDFNRGRNKSIENRRVFRKTNSVCEETLRNQTDIYGRFHNNEKIERFNENSTISDRLVDKSSQIFEKAAKNANLLKTVVKKTNLANEKETVSKEEKNDESQKNESLQCDWLSIEESQLQDILNSDVFKQFGIDPIQLIDENPDYFSHLFSLCACARCVCGLCRCRYSESKNANLRINPKGLQTNYQSEYFKKNGNLFPNDPVFSNFYQHLTAKGLPKTGFDYSTTNKAEYKPHNVDFPSKKLKKWVDNKNPFSSLSTYNSNFVDWRNYDKFIANAPNGKTVISELPFFGRTTYKDNYLNVKNDNSYINFVRNLHDNRKNQMCIAYNMPMIPDTTNSLNFKPYKVGPPKSSYSLKRKPSNIEIFPTKPHEGHYLSMTSHDFTGKHEFLCPAKKKIDINSIKSQIHEKMDNMEKEHTKEKSMMTGKRTFIS